MFLIGCTGDTGQVRWGKALRTCWSKNYNLTQLKDSKKSSLDSRKNTIYLQAFEKSDEIEQKKTPISSPESHARQPRPAIRPLSNR